MKTREHSFDEKTGAHWVHACGECQKRFGQMTNADEVTFINEQSVVTRNARVLAPEGCDHQEADEAA